MTQADAELKWTAEGVLRFAEGQGYLVNEEGAIPIPLSEIIPIPGHGSVSLAGQRACWTLYIYEISVNGKQ